MTKQDKIYLYVFLTLMFFVILYFHFKTSKKVLRKAKSFLGQEETGENKGFRSSNFEAKMRKIGWFKGAQWCAFFTRLVWLESLPAKYRKVAEKLTSGSSQQTFLNFQKDKSGLFEVKSRPKKGSIVVWQATRDASRGHVGIVTKVTSNSFETIEGNSNVNGHPGIVTRLKHSFEKSPSGLKLRGFINIK